MVSRGPSTGGPAGVLLVFLAVLGAPPVAAALSGSPWLTAVLAIPVALVAGFWLFGRLLLLLALLRLRRRGIVGVLVYSNSPVWQSHIEREWLPAAVRLQGEGDRVLQRRGVHGSSS